MIEMGVAKKWVFDAVVDAVAVEMLGLVAYHQKGVFEYSVVAEQVAEQTVVEPVVAAVVQVDVVVAHVADERVAVVRTGAEIKAEKEEDSTGCFLMEALVIQLSILLQDYCSFQSFLLNDHPIKIELKHKEKMSIQL